MNKQFRARRHPYELANYGGYPQVRDLETGFSEAIGGGMAGPRYWFRSFPRRVEIAVIRLEQQRAEWLAKLAQLEEVL